MNEVSVTTATEPEMEHYLRLAGWEQAHLYPNNWIDPKYRQPANADTVLPLVVKRVEQATKIQMQRDRDMIRVLQERLAIVESGT